MENEKEIESLINAFVEYRNLLSPIEENLRNFANTYDNMREDIKELSKSFDGNIQKKLDAIYNDIFKQFEKSKDLSSQIDNFKQKTDIFSTKMEKMMGLFEKLETRINIIDEIEKRVTNQIEKLDAIVEQKNKMYNIKDLEKNLEAYNSNVQKINEYINKDIAVMLKNNDEKLNFIRDKNESVLENLIEEKTNISELVNSYNETNKLLKNVVEKEDVNEQYIFEILDKWATERGVKTKKWGKMTQEEVLNLFNIVKLDNLTSFCAQIKKDSSILNLSFGRFPLLSVCYLYNSKQILKKFKKDLMLIDKFNVAYEPFELYKNFRAKSGRALKLYANTSDIIMPIEIMAILHKDGFVKRNFKNFAKNKSTSQKLEKIYKINNQNCTITEKKIKISAKKLSKTQKKVLILSNIFVFTVLIVCFGIVGIIANTIGLGTNNSPRKVYSAYDFSKIASSKNMCVTIMNDLTLSDELVIKNYNGTIFGNDKTITINYDYNKTLFNDFDGKIKDINFAFNCSSIEISDNLSLFCNTNNGNIENLNFSIDASLEFISENPTTYFCGLAVTNNGFIDNCKANFKINATSASGKDAYVCAISGSNNEKISNCDVLENSFAITKNVDVAGIAVENSLNAEISNCKNYAALTQNVDIEAWSPAVAGIALTNAGSIKNCYNHGNLKIDNTVETSNDAIIIIGGICASNNSTIYHSKNCSEITAISQNSASYIGGICGYVNTSGAANNPIIDFCIAEGNINFTKNSDDVYLYCGGIAGYMIGNITNCCSTLTFASGFNKETKNMVAAIIGATYGQAIVNPFTLEVLSVTMYLNISNNHYLISETIPQPIAIIYINSSQFVYVENASQLDFTPHETAEEIEQLEIYFDWDPSWEVQKVRSGWHVDEILR